MNLSRLQELTMLNEATSTMAKKRSASDDFEGIRSLVDDCLEDLKDKLGKGGNLAELMKSSGASKMDTVKDKNGKNVLNQIIALTTEYTKAVSKLMTEAEILVMQVNEDEELEGDLLTEASSDYSDSSDFTDEFYGMSQDIEKMKMKMKNPRWMKWMKVTDQNFGTDCQAPAQSAINAIGVLANQFNDIEDELDKAN